MKLLLLLLSLLVLPQLVLPQRAFAESLKLMSYNIRCGYCEAEGTPSVLARA